MFDFCNMNSGCCNHRAPSPMPMPMPVKPMPHKPLFGFGFGFGYYRPSPTMMSFGVGVQTGNNLYNFINRLLGRTSNSINQAVTPQPQVQLNYQPYNSYQNMGWYGGTNPVYNNLEYTSGMMQIMQNPLSQQQVDNFKNFDEKKISSTNLKKSDNIDKKDDLEQKEKATNTKEKVGSQNNKKTTLAELEKQGYDADAGKKLANIAIRSAENKSQGQCATYVKRAIQNAGLGNYVQGDAWKTTEILRNNPNFKEIDPTTDVNSLPAGCVLVYDKGYQGYSKKCGHTQIKTENGAASDFITRNVKQPSAIFMPITTSAMA